MQTALVAGVGMVKFSKPGSNKPFREMAAESIRIAMSDAGLEVGDIGQAFASHVYEVTGSGQHAIYDVMQTGIPIININNACASGSSGLFVARQLVESGASDCVLVVGFDEMPSGAIPLDFTTEMVGSRIDRVLDEHQYPLSAHGDILRWFGAAGMHYMEKYGANSDIFAKVAVKSRAHASNNPFAVMTAPLSFEQVVSAPVLYGDYLTKYMACPPTCGAAAAIIVGSSFAKQKGINNAVAIRAQSMVTDTPESWSDALMACGYGNTSRAAAEVFEASGVGPQEIDVVELHDCFTTNEVVSYEALQLCGEGEATRFIADNQNTYGGSVVVNPSGG
nr:lipid-transfer protein [Kineobactrum salinum]